MKRKIKLILLTILLNTITIQSFSLEKFNSELIVSGSDALERIEWTLIPDKLNGNNQYVQNGDVPIEHAIWADEGATIENIGKVYSERERYDTQVGGLLVDIINNKLKKQDDFVVLRGNNSLGKNTKLENYGVIDMGMLYHRVDIILSVLDLSFYNKYANYRKNVINSIDSNIYNEGTIKSEGDKLRLNTEVEVGLLQYNEVDYYKNTINMTNGNLNNKGLIEYDRDRNAEIVDFVGVDLVGLGLHYNRETSAINSINSNITNEIGGRIFVGGDLLEDRDYGGINLNVIGADFVGKHHKYGVKSQGGVIKNFGIIEVERDFNKAIDRHNNILDINLIYGGDELLGLGLLSFKNMNEKSVGVYTENGEFYNDGGTISVGANNKTLLTQIMDSSAIAVEANNSNIYFNEEKVGQDYQGTGKTSKLVLEGQNVYGTYLRGNSNAYFDGTVNVEYKLPNSLKPEKKDEYISKINKEIFRREEQATGGHYIKGQLNVNGDLKLTDANNVFVSTGGKIGNNEKIWGEIHSDGQIELAGNIKVDTENLVGLSDVELNKYENHNILSANKGIIGNGDLISDSIMFDIKSDKVTNTNNLGIVTIERKNLNSIIENKELGNILENNYENSSGKQLEFYKYLAEGEDLFSLNKKANEIAGADNITTLTSQIFDISKDLNKRYRKFSKDNSQTGFNFSYLNSESKLNKDKIYQGFERESTGIMTGYNKYISDKVRVGVGFSYMDSDINYTSKSSNEIETWNLRGYLNSELEKFNMYSDISFGYNDSQNKRFMNENLSVGKNNIYTFTLGNSIYKDYRISDKFIISPSLNFDFTYAYQENFDEKGGFFPIKVKESDGMYLNIGTELKAKYSIYSSNNIKVSLEGGADFSYDVYQNIDDTELIIFENNESYKEVSQNLDKKSLECFAGIKLDYKENYSIGLDYSKEIINDVENDKIGINFSYKF